MKKLVTSTGHAGSKVTSRKSGRDEHWFGTVTATLLNLRQGPGTEHVQIGSLAEHTPVEVLGRVGAWLQVNVNGQQGFVHSDWVRPAGLATVAPRLPPVSLRPLPRRFSQHPPRPPLSLTSYGSSSSSRIWSKARPSSGAHWQRR